MTTKILLSTPGSTTLIPWVNNAPDFSAFTEPTLSVLQNSWQAFLDSGQELEIIPDPEPTLEPVVPDWDAFNAYMLTNAMFKEYRDVVNTQDSDLTSALFNAYSIVDTKGLSAFSIVWGHWCIVSAITIEDREVIAVAAESYNLPTQFVEVLRG